MGFLFNRNVKEKKVVTCEHQSQETVEPQLADTPIVSNDHVEKENHAQTTTAFQTDAKGRCTLCRQEQLTARRYRLKLIIGVFFPFALSALDVTIIASALPWIALDFGMLFNSITSIN